MTVTWREALEEARAALYYRWGCSGCCSSDRIWPVIKQIDAALAGPDPEARDEVDRLRALLAQAAPTLNRRLQVAKSDGEDWRECISCGYHSLYWEPQKHHHWCICVTPEIAALEARAKELEACVAEAIADERRDRDRIAALEDTIDLADAHTAKLMERIATLEVIQARLGRTIADQETTIREQAARVVALEADNARLRALLARVKLEEPEAGMIRCPLCGSRWSVGDGRSRWDAHDCPAPEIAAALREG